VSGRSSRSTGRPPFWAIVGGTVHHDAVSEHADYDPYDLPGGQHARWLDTRGPEQLLGISRYPDYPDDMDWSDAILDPLSEAVGRFVGVCAQLEIALFRARSELDDLMTFAEAERTRRPKGCIEDLRGLASGLPARSSARLLGLLDAADRFIQLRNGVVHGTYRMNHLARGAESRRYVYNKATRQYDLVRVPYERDSLLLAVTRTSNVAADILDGIADWQSQLRRAAHVRRGGVTHRMVYQEFTSASNVRPPSRRDAPDPEPTVLLHALDKDALSTVCGLDATAMKRYRDLSFEDSNPRNHCRACRKAIGL